MRERGGRKGRGGDESGGLGLAGAGTKKSSSAL